MYSQVRQMQVIVIDVRQSDSQLIQHYPSLPLSLFPSLSLFLTLSLPQIQTEFRVVLRSDLSRLARTVILDGDDEVAAAVAEAAGAQGEHDEAWQPQVGHRNDTE